MATRNRTVYSTDGVRVEGLAEFQRSIRKVSKEVAKSNRVQFKRIGEHVAAVARGKIRNNITGAAASSIKGMGSNAGASVRFPAGGRGSSSDAVGYFPWLDFGGAPRLGRGVTSSIQAGTGVRRAVIKEGRYVYPAIRDSQAYIVEQMEDLVEDVARGEGFEVRG